MVKKFRGLDVAKRCYDEQSGPAQLVESHGLYYYGV